MAFRLSRQLTNGLEPSWRGLTLVLLGSQLGCHLAPWVSGLIVYKVALVHGWCLYSPSNEEALTDFRRLYGQVSSTYAVQRA